MTAAPEQAVPDSPAPAEAPALDVRGLQFTYPARGRQPARTVLEHLDLAVPAGQTVALLGPNGSGKSTLMKIVCGLLPSDAGEVALFGESDPAVTRRSLGVVFQSPGLDPYLTVRENLRDQARLYGLSRGESLRRVQEEVDLAELSDRSGALVKTLSGGLARRVDLCRALLHRPRLLMLDEPTVGLDPAAREGFLDLIERRHRDENLTVLMSTHLVDEAARCDRVLLMHAGRIVADDSPAALRRRLGARRVIVHDGDWQPPTGAAAPWTRGPVGWSRPLDADARTAGDLAAELTRDGIAFSIAPPTLADVFEDLTGATLGHAPAPAPAPAEAEAAR